MKIKVLKFSSDICPSCINLEEQFNKIKIYERYSDSIEFIEFKVGDPEAIEYRKKYDVRNFPTLVALNQDDEIIGKMVGLRKIDGMISWFDDLVLSLNQE